MPYRRRRYAPRRRRGRRGRQWRRANKRIPRTVAVNRSRLPMSPRFVTTLKYSQAMAITCTTAGSAYWQRLNLNGLYDPDATIGGHQPYGFDALMAMYSTFRVFATSWTITCSGTSQSATILVIPTLGPMSPGLTEWDYYAEQPYATSKAISYNGGPPAVFRGKMWLPKLASVTSAVYKAEATYTGSASANPASLLNLFIGARATANATVCPIQVTLKFHAEFYDPVLMAQS